MTTTFPAQAEAARKWVLVDATGQVLGRMATRIAIILRCKDALFEPDQLTLRLSSAKGYALSIGLLLGVPAALAGTVATLLVRSHRQRRGTQRRGPLDPSGQSR